MVEKISKGGWDIGFDVVTAVYGMLIMVGCSFVKGYNLLRVNLEGLKFGYKVFFESISVDYMWVDTEENPMTLAVSCPKVLASM